MKKYIIPILETWEVTEPDTIADEIVDNLKRQRFSPWGEDAEELLKESLSYLKQTAKDIPNNSAIKQEIRILTYKIEELLINK